MKECLNKVIRGDCLEVMKKLPDKCVDLVLTDPPYYKIMEKDCKWEKIAWDNWRDTIQDWVIWLEQIVVEIKRILKTNWSFFIFWDDKNTAYMQVMIDKYFNIENNIVWYKPNNMTARWWKNFRCYCPMTERLLFYTNESRNNNLNNEFYAENIKVFAPIIEYMIEQKRMIKDYFNFKTDNEFNEYIGKIIDKISMWKHYFEYHQWAFPTEEIYKKLQSINKDIFKKEYEVFKKEYEELRKEYEDSRRYFKQEKNYTDVWEYNAIWWNENVEHPTQKPLSLIKPIIHTNSKKQYVVLDPFLGSWTTAVACKELWRNFIGIEREEKYCKIAEKRLRTATVSLF